MPKIRTHSRTQGRQKKGVEREEGGRRREPGSRNRRQSETTSWPTSCRVSCRRLANSGRDPLANETARLKKPPLRHQSDYQAVVTTIARPLVRRAVRPKWMKKAGIHAARSVSSRCCAQQRHVHTPPAFGTPGLVAASFFWGSQIKADSCS